MSITFKICILHSQQCFFLNNQHCISLDKRNMKQLAFWLMLMSSFTDKEAGLDKSADMAELGPQPTPLDLPFSVPLALVRTSYLVH